MNPEQRTNLRKELDELASAYAVGAASPEEVQVVSDYLDICRSFDADLAMLRTTMQAVPLSLEEMEPPPALRSSILAAIEADKAASPSQLAAVPSRPAELVPEPTPIATDTARSTWLPWAAVAALLLLSIGLAAWNVTLRDSNSETAPTIALAATSPDVQGSGEVSYLVDEGIIVIDLQDAAPLGDGQVYQVWVIRGDTPASAGVLSSESATLAFAGNPDDYDLVAVTVEAGPVGVPAPTTTPLFAAELSGL